MKPFAFTQPERDKIVAAIDAAIEAGLIVNTYSTPEWVVTVEKNKQELINAIETIVAEG